MKTKAVHRRARVSAQKARLVIDQIRGLSVDHASRLLRFCKRRNTAVLIEKVLNSAVANAEHNQGADVDALRIVEAYIDKATSLKRSMPRAKGRGNRIEKQTCHITVVVGD